MAPDLAQHEPGDDVGPGIGLSNQPDVAGVRQPRAFRTGNRDGIGARGVDRDDAVKTALAGDDQVGAAMCAQSATKSSLSARRMRLAISPGDAGAPTSRARCPRIQRRRIVPSGRAATTSGRRRCATS